MSPLDFREPMVVNGQRFDSQTFFEPQETVGGATLSLAFGDLLTALEASVISNLHSQGASMPIGLPPNSGPYPAPKK